MVFTDLSNNDASKNSKLFLICNVTTSLSTTGVRKPVGVCATEVRVNFLKGKIKMEKTTCGFHKGAENESLVETFRRLDRARSDRG